MHISEWLTKNNKTQADLGRIIKRYPVRAHRILNGSMPTADEMRLIFEATFGQVTANDFYDLPSNGHEPPGPSHD